MEPINVTLMLNKDRHKDWPSDIYGVAKTKDPSGQQIGCMGLNMKTQLIIMEGAFKGSLRPGHFFKIIRAKGSILADTLFTCDVELIPPKTLLQDGEGKWYIAPRKEPSPEAGHTETLD
jgi:hypothetical protein